MITQLKSHFIFNHFLSKSEGTKESHINWDIIYSKQYRRKITITHEITDNILGSV